ncbi:MAG: radical SAM protein [Peptococcaceae bacterium BICA1-7]|nr:MAG: radical SAM protein [Peptococcaceae bacterium BICA1-7]HBV99532.1 radical SAM protein [Desulfotomaculum sp.]
MAVYICAQCGSTVESRCRPGKCKNCGAVKDKLIKQEQPKK